MPVANIIETQENVENSGSESSGPSLMLPYREIARYAEKITNDALVSTKSQPNESVIQVRTLVVPLPIASGATTPEITKAIESAAATPNTTLSTGSLPSGSLADVGSFVQVGHRVPALAVGVAAGAAGIDGAGPVRDRRLS